MALIEIDDFPSNINLHLWLGIFMAMLNNQRVHQYPEDQRSADRIINQPTGIRFGTLPENGPKMRVFQGGQTF